MEKVTAKIYKPATNEHMEEVLPSVGLMAGFLEGLAEKSPEYWTAKVYVEDTFFYSTNKFMMNPNTDVLPAMFEFKNEAGNEIRLIIKENKNGYVLIDVFLNGEQIADNSDAFVYFYDKCPERAYLQFKNINSFKLTMLCICDLSKEQNMTVDEIKQNRAIANLLFELGKECNELFPFSIYSMEVEK